MVEKLTPNNDFLNPEELTRNLKTKIIGKKVYFFKRIPSTNIFAKELIKECPVEGTIVIADVQTSGRGRKNRFWYSPSGGLWFSVILYPNLSPKIGILITMAVSISIVQAIKDITGLETEIKWPNDLLLNGKKVCGVLTEIDADSDKIKYAIVGIGINVNNLIDKKLKNTAISLKEGFGSEVSRIKILKPILEYLDNNYYKLINQKFEYIKKAWLSYTKIIGRKIQVINENIIIEGIVQDIDDNGYLILKTNSGSIKIVNGDIKYL